MTPFLWLCLIGGLAIFSSTMSKNPALPLFIHSLGVDEGTLGFIAAASTVVGEPSLSALNTGSQKWQPISPSAPVPKSHHPRHLNGI